MTPKRIYDLGKTWGPALVSVATAAISAYAFVEAELQHRISSAIEDHNTDWTATAHPRLGKRISDIADQCHTLDETAEKVERVYKALYEMYWFRVGEKAVELEPNRNLKAHTRARVQEQFVQLVKQGETLEDAYRRALSQAAGLP